MCTTDINPFTSNNLLVRGAGAFVSFGGTEAYRARKSWLPDKPDPPLMPKLPPSPREARAPDIPPPKRNKNSDGTPSVGNTVLTGALGVDPSRLNIGRTALGGGY